jgi:hypothetical protein
LLSISAVCLVSSLPDPINRVSGESFIPNKALNTNLHKIKTSFSSFAKPEKSSSSKNLGISFCKTCINFADDALDELLNAILNAGVVGSCGSLCNYVAQKVGNQYVGIVCNLLCDYVGITEFIKVVENADLDPIWYCEILKACPINDNGDAKFTKFTITPNQGPQGTTFTASLQYVSVNGTGTGELYIGVKTVDGIPLEDSFLVEAQKPGTYLDNINIQAQPDPQCDPSQGPCEQWLPGKYTVEIGN